MSATVNIAEYDPAVVRALPFLSRRRRQAVDAIESAIASSMGGRSKWKEYTGIAHGELATITIRSYSSRTLEMIVQHFGDTRKTGILNFLANCSSDPHGEMFTRAFLTYHHVLKAALPDQVADTLSGAARGELWIALSSAKMSDVKFIRHEDISVLQGDDRKSFEALLFVFTSNVRRNSGESRPYMSAQMTALVMSKPDRAADIIGYQKDRELELCDLDPVAVEEYLNAPALSLGSGVL